MEKRNNKNQKITIQMNEWKWKVFVCEATVCNVNIYGEIESKLLIYMPCITRREIHTANSFIGKLLGKTTHTNTECKMKSFWF